MLEPYVLPLSLEEYENILRSRWHLFNQQLSPKHWEFASKCLRLQSNYLKRQLFVPLSFIWGNKQYVFLRLNGENFSSNDEKVQFVKEVTYLSKIDFQIKRTDPLNLGQFLSGYNPDSSDVLPLIQIFVEIKQD